MEVEISWYGATADCTSDEYIFIMGGFALLPWMRSPSMVSPRSVGQRPLDRRNSKVQQTIITSVVVPTSDVVIYASTLAASRARMLRQLIALCIADAHAA